MSIIKLKVMKVDKSDWFNGKTKLIIENVLVVSIIDIFYELFTTVYTVYIAYIQYSTKRRICQGIFGFFFQGKVKMKETVYSMEPIYYYKVYEMAVMQNYKIHVSYDGTEYQGWQRQPNKKTIQGLLESALEKIAAKKIPVIGSGRTDAGVHAVGQVAHFKVNTRLENDEFLRALNGILPSDIRIQSLKKASPDFHAQKSARSKIYQYRIFNSSDISPFIVRYVLQWTSSLDTEKMAQAAGLLVREADFTPFSSNRLLSPIRIVTRSEIRKKGKEIVYTVEANGFLRYMVRSMVGALIEVGRGKLDLGQIECFFKLNKRSHLCPTAPAKGLTLIKVKY